MVFQFTFAQHKDKNQFNLAVNNYIKILRLAYDNPEIDDETSEYVDRYFLEKSRLLKRPRALLHP